MIPLWQAINTSVVTAFSMQDYMIGVALAFLLSQLVAWTYIYTHSGVSYSKSFVQSIVVLTVIVTLAMMIIGNNIVVAFGLLGALSMIRFRNVLKDTRDTTFIFFSVVTGIACGTGCRALAIGGCLLFCLLLGYLHLTEFGTRRDSDAFLRFHSDPGVFGLAEMQAVLRRYSFSFEMVTQRVAEDGGMDVAFQLALRDPDNGVALVEALRSEDGVSGVTLLRQAHENEL